MKIIMGNWKSQKNSEQSLDWFETFGKLYSPEEGKLVIVAPPFTSLEVISGKFSPLPTNLFLAAQDVSPFPLGAYTGAVAANMLTGLTDYCLVGHSERRQYFSETHQHVANKVDLLLEQQITPVVCIDESYAKDQINALEQNQLEKLIIAYEPLEAIGSGQPQAPEEISEVVASVGKLLPRNVPILYGGSVNDNNFASILNIEGVSGVLVGGASLDPEKFALICGKIS